jgi:dipeptidyl aminopeptidase/acylaminoacyl peptidase
MLAPPVSCGAGGVVSGGACMLMSIGRASALGVAVVVISSRPLGAQDAGVSTMAPPVGPAVSAVAAPLGRRLLTLDDMTRERDAGDPRVSPDGQWVAYSVSGADTAHDVSVSAIFLTSWDGRTTRRLTWSKEGEHLPRWSPDGRALAFLSARDDEHDVDQLWILPRDGGEAQRITTLPGGVLDVAWAPDGHRLAVIANDPDPDSTAGDTAATKSKTPKPIVITRFQFRADNIGWLDERRARLYTVDLATRATTVLTTGPIDAALPSWSPDGHLIAYVAKRGEDADRTSNHQIFTIEPRAGATPHQITMYDGNDNDPEWVPGPPAWSPDGKWIAYVRGGPERMLYYSLGHLAVVPAGGGPECIITPTLDRTVTQPQWSADGSAVYFLLEDDRAVEMARVAVTAHGDSAVGGAIDRLVTGRQVLSGFEVTPGGRAAFVASTPNIPPEIYVLDDGVRPVGNGGSMSRQLSHENGWLDSVELATTREVTVHSQDGTVVSGFIVTPPGYTAGHRYPTILRIHGGPVEQYDDSFEYDWQLMAAHGYVVVADNPRGSSGRGQVYTSAIYADWGNKDSQDVLAVVDKAVADGIADSARLGVGGWSYGGILTDEVIARTARFKAATSGAGMANAFAGYGTDQYVREYEAELGTPWTHPEAWTRVSFPFLHANRIVTPTLFFCGDLDANVPLINSEQLYQALRSLGRQTALIVYPGEYHEFTKLTHLRDRLQRYLGWYDRFLAPDAQRAQRAHRAPHEPHAQGAQ